MYREEIFFFFSWLSLCSVAFCSVDFEDFWLWQIITSIRRRLVVMEFVVDWWLWRLSPAWWLWRFSPAFGVGRVAKIGVRGEWVSRFVGVCVYSGLRYFRFFQWA